MKLHLVPIRFRDAAAFVAMWHRHNLPPVGCKFCTAVADEEGVLRGVAIIGPCPHVRNGQTLEVNRTATDGTPNANSMLYAAAWRATKALGYTRLITYTQADETGASLRAAGWRVVAQRPARPGWSVPSRPRKANGSEHMPRTLWEAAS
ncbi:conserved hypothetical protein [Streptomyces himastatinicus ATCC 53653]|uniref:N-acetyltransferase domain-containing protein n=1 Tax=Streptomyces himastatinicus ATCC 53653 TaxID=457427 RepID=D9WX02_9ACTN|nr:XF1762 family protein [Streptomyces himastatinicus]EFL29430.1 conserved hypothetical protein [Streptomyces himastatinicus ATCC 53653]